MTNIKPLGSLILIKTEEEKDKTTKSGLVIASAVVDSTLKEIFMQSRLTQAI